MADVVIGAKLQLDGKDAENSVKSLKSQLREAQQEVVKLSDKFGATSNEAQDAAKRAAELKDRIGDAKGLIDAFNPDQKFMALSQSLGGVLGGFTALTGAMGLLGVESEDVQKQLLKVQSAMALSQGLNQIGDSIQSFKNLGAVIVSTLGKSGAIGLAIAGVAALGTAIYAAFKNTEKLTEEQKRYNEASDRALKNEGARIAGLQILIEKIKKGGLTQAEKTKTLEDYNTNLGDTLGKYATYQKLEAALIANGPKYIQYLMNKAKADAAYGMLVEEYQKKLTAERTKASEFTGFSILGIFFDDETTHKTNKDKAIQRIDSDINSIASLYDKAKGEADKLQGELNIITGGPKIDKATTSNSKGNEAQKAAEEEAKYLKIARDYEMEQFKKKIELKKIENGELAALDNERFMQSSALAEAQNRLAWNTAEINAQAAEMEADRKIRSAQLVGNILGSLADLVGKQTVAGKALAIAQATIDTYAAGAAILKNTARTPAGGLPGYAIAQMIAVIAAGLVQVRNIVKTKVPGFSAGGGGGTNVSSAQAPITPQLPNATRTTLDQQQLNQIGNATVRAFVVESDVSGSQDRIRRLNRAARL